MLWIDAVILGFGHLLGSTDPDGLTVGLEQRRGNPALVIRGDIHLIGPDVLLAALGFTEEGRGDHHALGQESGKRFLGAKKTRIAQQLVIETGVEEVEDRMFDPANVLIDGEPVIGALVQHGLCVICRGIASKIPRRFHEGIKGVRLPLCGFAAARAGDVHEIIETRQR